MRTTEMHRDKLDRRWGGGWMGGAEGELSFRIGLNWIELGFICGRVISSLHPPVSLPVELHQSLSL